MHIWKRWRAALPLLSRFSGGDTGETAPWEFHRVWITLEKDMYYYNIIYLFIISLTAKSKDYFFLNSERGR